MKKMLNLKFSMQNSSLACSINILHKSEKIQKISQIFEIFTSQTTFDSEMNKIVHIAEKYFQKSPLLENSKINLEKWNFLLYG